MFTHTVTRTYKDSSATAITLVETVSGDTENNFAGLIAIAANKEVDLVFTHADLKSLALSSDQAVTIFTNAASGSSPQDTIHLVAGQVLVWTLATDGIGKCPFSDDVTKLFITNASSAAANVKVKSLQTQAV